VALSDAGGEGRIAVVTNPPTPSAVTIRPEGLQDAAAVLALIDSAFERPRGADRTVESVLVDWLREDSDVIAELTLVAEVDGEIVGQVTCSRGTLAGRPSVGLGPISVAPDHQRRGVGSALMEAALAAAEVTGEPVVVLVGDPKYYSRFGFVPASTLGIESPGPWGDAYFQARPLATWSAGLAGPFRYAAAFERLVD
jgi:putative acetyltransferase